MDGSRAQAVPSGSLKWTALKSTHGGAHGVLLSTAASASSQGLLVGGAGTDRSHEAARPRQVLVMSHPQAALKALCLVRTQNEGRVVVVSQSPRMQGPESLGRRRGWAPLPRLYLVSPPAVPGLSVLGVGTQHHTWLSQEGREVAQKRHF